MKQLLLVVIAVLLGSCAAPVKEQRSVDQETRTKQILARDSWALRGRIGVSNGQDGGSARIRWNATASAYELWIFAPLGQGTWRLTGDALGATLAGPRGTFTGSDANALLIEHLGWHLPVDALTWWVRGLAAPGTPANVTYNDAGHPAVIEQSGWRVQFTEWADYAAFDLPRRIEAVQTPYRVKLVIQDWALQRTEDRGLKAED